jgi:hypothetical protein
MKHTKEDGGTCGQGLGHVAALPPAMRSMHKLSCTAAIKMQVCECACSRRAYVVPGIVHEAAFHTHSHLGCRAGRPPCCQTKLTPTANTMHAHGCQVAVVQSVYKICKSKHMQPRGTLLLQFKRGRVVLQEEKKGDALHGIAKPTPQLLWEGADGHTRLACSRCTSQTPDCIHTRPYMCTSRPCSCCHRAAHAHRVKRVPSLLEAWQGLLLMLLAAWGCVAAAGTLQHALVPSWAAPARAAAGQGAVLLGPAGPLLAAAPIAASQAALSPEISQNPGVPPPSWVP